MLSLQLELEVAASKRFLWRLVAFGLPMPAVPEPQKAESDATHPEIAKAALKILVQHLESIEASVAVRARTRETGHVALANKLARITWAVMTTGETIRMEIIRGQHGAAPFAARLARSFGAFEFGKRENRREGRYGRNRKPRIPRLVSRASRLAPLIGTFAPRTSPRPAGQKAPAIGPDISASRRSKRQKKHLPSGPSTYDAIFNLVRLDWR